MLYIHTEGGMVKLSHSEVIFCEVTGHTVILHTSRGDFSRYTSLKYFERLLSDEYFVKCNHCYLVNLQYVKNLGENFTELTYCDQRYVLQVSRNKRKAFGKAWQEFAQKSKSGWLL